MCAALLATGSFVQAETPDLQSWIDARVASGEVLAVTAMLFEDGKVTHLHGGTLLPAGGEQPDPETQFQIGSITKAFTNLLLAEMVAAGRVRYDSTIASLVDEDVEFANPDVAGITLLELATHTSGLPRLPANLAPADPLNPYAGYDESMLLRALASSRDKQPLGNHYAYSNFGVGLLGYLLGRAHGDGYVAALNEWVIVPLGLERTAPQPAGNVAAGYRGGQVVPAWDLGALAGAGALWGSTGDFLRLARIHLGEIDSGLRHDLADDRVIVSRGPGGFDVTAVWHVAPAGDDSIFWHNGGTGGYWSFFGFRPGAGTAVAILVSGDPNVTDLGLQWLGATDVDRPAARVDESVFGQFRLTPDAEIGVYALNGTLVAQLSGQPPLPLSAVGKDWYAVDVADASLHFLRAEGAVVAVELAQNGRVQRAERVSDTADALSKTSVALSREALSAYVGEYPINAAAKFTIRLGEAGLEAQITGQPFFPIFAKGDDVFFYKVVDAELHFERDDGGAIKALVLHQGPIEQRAEKMR